MRSLSLFLLLIVTGCLAQEKLLSGRIVVKDATPGGVRILNLVNEKEAVSDAQGNFIILVKPDDLLVCSAVHLDLMRHIVEEDEFHKGAFAVTMTARTNQLEEVEIQTQTLDPVALRILDRPAKTYTPAERRLRTSRHVFVSAIEGGGVGFGFDPVLTYLTGRTGKMKKDLNVEVRERSLKRMQNLYGATYYVDYYGIGESESLAFEYFCIEDEEFRKALQSPDRTASSQRLFFLAAAFLKLQEGDVVTNPEKE